MQRVHVWLLPQRQRIRQRPVLFDGDQQPVRDDRFVQGAQSEQRLRDVLRRGRVPSMLAHVLSRRKYGRRPVVFDTTELAVRHDRVVHDPCRRQPLCDVFRQGRVHWVRKGLLRRFRHCKRAAVVFGARDARPVPGPDEARGRLLDGHANGQLQQV